MFAQSGAEARGDEKYDRILALLMELKALNGY
jgi:hypothetical protein